MSKVDLTGQMSVLPGSVHVFLQMGSRLPLWKDKWQATLTCNLANSPERVRAWVISSGKQCLIADATSQTWKQPDKSTDSGKARRVAQQKDYKGRWWCCPLTACCKSTACNGMWPISSVQNLLVNQVCAACIEERQVWSCAMCVNVCVCACACMCVIVWACMHARIFKPVNLS